MSQWFVCFLALVVSISSCKKELSYERPAKIPFVSAWEFKQDTSRYTGTFDSVNITKTGNVYTLIFVSGPSANLNQNIEIRIADTLRAGTTYKASAGFLQFVYYQSGFPIYTSVPLDTSREFALTITDISDSTVVGTFSGKARDAALNMKDIKEGKFSAKLIPAANPANDYYPMTQNSFWSYNVSLNGFPLPDSAKLTLDGAALFNMNLYNRFLREQNGVIGADTFFFRKSGNDYYEYCEVDTYCGLFSFDAPVRDDILFLKENAPVGTSWQSNEFAGTTTGTPTKLRYTFTIDQVNTTLVVSGKTYNNVITVKYVVQVNVSNTTYNTIENGLMSFAQGVGLIQRKLTQAGTNANLGELGIRVYHIN